MNAIEISVVGDEEQKKRRLQFEWLEEDGRPRMVGIDFLVDERGHVTEERFATLLDVIATYMRQPLAILAKAHSGTGCDASG